MQKLIIEIVSGWIRAGLLILSAWLIQRHVVSEDQSASFIKMTLEWVVESLPAVIALAWQWWRTHTSQVKLLTALTLPVGSTENDVIAKVKSGEATPAVTTPPNTIPGVPK